MGVVNAMAVAFHYILTLNYETTIKRIIICTNFFLSHAGLFRHGSGRSVSKFFFKTRFILDEESHRESWREWSQNLQWVQEMTALILLQENKEVTTTMEEKKLKISEGDQQKK